MKRLIYTMGIALMLNSLAEVRAEIPLKPNSDAPRFSERIQPAAAEYGEYNYKYDTWGNITEQKRGDELAKSYLIQTWDNSKGYPILLDSYSYSIMSDGTETDKDYSQRTTLDASGVRTALHITPYGDIPLDAAGHALSYDYDSHNNETESSRMTWDGDRLATLKYHYIYGSDTEVDVEMTNIEIAHQTRPFNAYELKYYDLLNEPLKSGIWINADGTGTWKRLGNTYSGVLTVRTEISEDKKTLTKTVKIGDKLIRLDKMVLTDDNGSHTFYVENENGFGSEAVYTYNAYGDLIKDANKFDPADADFNLYEWQYDAEGRPLQVERYRAYGLDDEKELKEKIVFTAWHDGTSINAIEAGEARILGAALYTTDGTKVRTLTAEEVQGADSMTAPQRGVYLMVVQTERGIQTRKVVL